LTPRLLSGTFRGFQLLTLTDDKLLSNFALNCKVRHYSKGLHPERPDLTLLRWGGANPQLDPKSTLHAFNA